MVVRDVPPAAALAGEEFGVEGGSNHTVQEVFVVAVGGDVRGERKEVFAAVLEAGAGTGQSVNWIYGRVRGWLLTGSDLLSPGK